AMQCSPSSSSFFFSSRRRHTRFSRDWSSDVCSSDLVTEEFIVEGTANAFRPARPLTEDGLWSVEQGERASYATRLVVCRPAAIEIGRASCRGRVGERGAAVPSSEKYNRMS